MSVRFSFATKLFSLMAGAALLAAAPAAHADAFSFSFSGGGMSASGYLVYSNAAVPGVPGAVQITNAVGTFTDTNIGLVNAAILNVIPVALPSGINPDGTFVPPGAQADGYGFSWDNLFYTNGNSPAVCPPPGPGDPNPPFPYGGGYLDIYGMLFEVQGGYVVDVWSNGVIPKFGLTYGAGDSLNGKVLTTFGEPFSGTSLDVAGGPLAAPEPESLVLLGTGMLGAVGMIRRRLMAR
jgi:PEP-CTERM motif